MSLPSPILQRRLESAAVLAAAALVYGHMGFAWSTFALCFFLPDLSIAFYLIDRRTGGAVYNLAHFYLWPVALGAFGILGESLGAQMAALIWGGHVAFDRALGWGLKYETSFCHTDMGVKELAYPVAFLGPQDAE